MRVCLALLLVAAPRFALADEPSGYTLTESQLAPTQQAIGWWLGGAGVASGLAGAYMLMIREHLEPEVHDVQLGAGIALLALSAASLGLGIVLMATGDPGPCEIHGTAHDGVEASLSLTPLGLSGRF